MKIKVKKTMQRATKGFLMIGGVIFWPLFTYGMIKGALEDSDK